MLGFTKLIKGIQEKNNEFLWRIKRGWIHLSFIASVLLPFEEESRVWKNEVRYECNTLHFLEIIKI